MPDEHLAGNEETREDDRELHEEILDDPPELQPSDEHSPSEENGHVPEEPLSHEEQPPTEDDEESPNESPEPEELEESDDSEESEVSKEPDEVSEESDEVSEESDEVSPEPEGSEELEIPTPPRESVTEEKPSSSSTNRPSRHSIQTAEHKLERSIEKILGEDDSMPMEQRLRRLEDALAQLQDPRPAPTPTESTPMPPPAPVAMGNGKWSIRDVYADARAMWRMFVDPRYSLSLFGRFMPLGLLVLYVFSYYLIPGTSVPILGWILNKLADLVIAFFLFHVLIREARRYRQTSPDIPPSMRLR